MGMNILIDLMKKNRQLILYGIIGTSGATLDFVAFFILYNLIHLNPLISTMISTTLGITNNFILNILFNFRVRNKLHHRYLLFYTVGLLGLALSVSMIYVFHDRVGYNANIVKLCSIPVIVLIQYLLNSRIALSQNFKGLPLHRIAKTAKESDAE